MKRFLTLMMFIVVLATSIGFVGCGGKISYDLNSTSDGYVVNSKMFGGKEVVIEAEYEGKPVTEIAKDAFNGNSQLSTITIPSSIKKIGAGAFGDCKNLKSVEFPPTITSFGECCFYESGIEEENYSNLPDWCW